MREKSIEQKLCQATKQCGSICPKFVSPGFDGMPDCIVLVCTVGRKMESISGTPAVRKPASGNLTSPKRMVTIRP